MQKQKQTQKTKMPNHTEKPHTPVLVEEVLKYLSPKKGESFLDLTAGYGGHAEAILKATGAPELAYLVDRDQQAIDALKKRFKGNSPKIVHSEFLSTLEKLAGESRQFDMILADLGVSSPHLEDSERGFAFSKSGPLDMRMDRRQEVTADLLVNHTKESELAEILKEYGEEPKATAIARAIVANRPILNTSQLAAIIAESAGYVRRHGKIHPATRSFQAIRIAVNDELKQIEAGLPLMLEVLSAGGRLAIISFHSLEDRLVKQFFSENSGNRYDAYLNLLTKRPITASRVEIVSNPRARSAKLRASSKNKNK